MADAAPPSLPFVPPPSIEEAVQEYLNVIREVREMRREMAQLRADVGRAIDASTTTKMMLYKLAKHFGVKVDE